MEKCSVRLFGVGAVLDRRGEADYSIYQSIYIPNLKMWSWI